MKNPEMLIFDPDPHKTKTKSLCKQGVKKLPFLIRYIPD